MKEKIFGKIKRIFEKECSEKKLLLFLNSEGYWGRFFVFFKKFIISIILIVSIPFLLFYGAIFGYLGYIRLNVYFNYNKIFASEYDRKLAESIEFALLPLEKEDKFGAKSKVSENLRGAVYEYSIEDINYVCAAYGRYSISTGTLLKDLDLKTKYADTIDYKKLITGGNYGTLFLIVKKNGDYIPIVVTSKELDVKSNFKFGYYDEPPCQKTDNLKIKIKSEYKKNTEITFE